MSGQDPGAPPDAVTPPTVESPLPLRRRAEPASPGADADAAELLPGASIGRYIVQGRLAEGGMGVIYAARDPQLGRRVAIKVLRVDAGRRGKSARARDRLLREAQALAQLAHPNVVAVHDVGILDDDVFIAMELVDGRTLAELRADARDWRTQLPLLRQAGEGLAAAHRAGLVHRDFKPGNVVVGLDGRARVLDFGLARVAHDDPATGGDGSASGEADASDPSGGGASPDRLHTPLTQQGSVLGTPAYMAPEHHAGRPCDARSDQFSFCMTAWELLIGERPFDGPPAAVQAALAAGRTPTAPDASVPAWIRRALARGLSADPAARWPSMDALLAALARDPARQRQRLLVGAALVVTAGVAGFALLRPGAAPPAPCTGAEARTDAVWNAEARQAVRGAFTGTGKAYGEETFLRVDRALDAYLGDWRRMHTETCRATHVDRSQSPAVLDLRMRCLERRLHKVQALTTVLGRPSDAGVLKQALPAVYALPSLSACADVEQLAAAQPPPNDPAGAARAQELGARLDDVDALREAGLYGEALPLATTIVAEARELAFDPVLAEALYLLGQLQVRSGQAEPADATLREAARVAARAGDDRLVAQSFSMLIFDLGLLARFPEAHALQDPVEVIVLRAGDDPVVRGVFLANVGTLYNRQARYAEARPYFERAITLLEGALGPEHPELAGPLNNLANVLQGEERYDEARRAYARAIAIYDKAYGPGHPAAGVPLVNLANTLSAQGQLAEARLTYARALDVFLGGLGPDHPNVAAVLNSMGGVDAALGQHDDALRSYRRAREIWEKRLGPEHPDVAMTIYNEGDVLLTRGDARGACAAFARALAMEEKSLEPTDPSLAYKLQGLGKCHLAQGRAAEALPPLERALAIREAGQVAASDLASTRYTLAVALRAAKRDPRRARRLAEQALAALPADAAHLRELRDEVTAFLAAKR